MKYFAHGLTVFRGTTQRCAGLYQEGVSGSSCDQLRNPVPFGWKGEDGPSVILNSSWATGRLEPQWKHARIVPILKLSKVATFLRGTDVHRALPSYYAPD